MGPEAECYVCGAKELIEMHHVKHIRKEGIKTTGFTQLMSRLNRKQVPVCRQCHIKIHRGQYNGITLKKADKEIEPEIGGTILIAKGSGADLVPIPLSDFSDND